MTIDLASLRACFSGKFYTNQADMAPYLLDWRRRYQGLALAVVEPDSTQDVASIVRWCQSNEVAVVPQGGNTGLSGGSVPNKSGLSIVLSLRGMSNIRSIDTVNNTLTVEAGCILQTVQNAALAAHRLFPLSLASQGSCTIGGNLSTNAGGVQVLRYGNARELCLGLEVVTAQGEIWNGLRSLRKDNTGYDLRDVYIGSEGTLGIITAAVLKLYPLPAAKQVAWVSVQSPEMAMRLLGLAQERLGAGLTAFELISDVCLSLVLQHFPVSRSPLQSAAPWYVLLECSDFVSHTNGAELLESLLQVAVETELILDAAISDNETQFQAIWALRENISEAQAIEGKNIKHDIAVPISSIASFVETTTKRVLEAFPDVRMVIFGHLGDGNLHYNVSPAIGELDEHSVVLFLNHQDAINLIVHDAVAFYEGSVSAEHGLGVLRRDEAARYKSPVELGLMQAIKAALDPQNRMNPGKVIAMPPNGSLPIAFSDFPR